VINALTIDVEDYFHVQAFAGVVRPEEWCRFPLRVESNTYRLLEILNPHGIHATFFMLGWVAERCPNLARDILKAGHEVGCHGYDHQMISARDETSFRRDVIRAKSLLEDQLGTTVRAYRAPSYSITQQTLWALEVLGEAGFEFDSSIFPVHHDHYGMPNAPRFPHYKCLRDGRRILEFPPSTLSFYGFNIPVAGGGYFRLFPYQFTAWAIRRINEMDAQPALVYLHPWEIDPDQPRVSASWKSQFRHYHNLQSTEEKFAQLLGDFCWGPLSKAVGACEASSEGEVDHGL
jgi:polysaccharide deacetylase family protein (PEP-CTERM system associated)